MTYAFDYILPPEIYRGALLNDPNEMRINKLIQPWEGNGPADVALLAVPFARASQRGDSGAGKAPAAIRQAFAINTTYSPDFDVDLKSLRVRDLGEVKMHITDIARCHRNMEEAVVELYKAIGDSLLVILSGDNSGTCPLVQGYCRAHNGRPLGIVHFDAHNDVRVLDHGGPSDGTPFRGILEGPANVEGRNLVQLGIHGFMNSSTYKKYLDDKGATVITARQIRKRGIEAVIEEAIRIAGEGTDSIFVTIDIDCLSSVYAPGSGASTPEGMSAWDMVEAMFILGQHPKVKALEVCCIDPLLDVRMQTVKMGASAVLTFLGGYVIRRTGGRGY